MSPSPASRGKFGSKLDAWREFLFRPGWLVLLAGLLATPVLAPWALRQIPELPTRQEYRLPMGQIQLSPAPPPAIPPHFLDQIQALGQFEPELSVLDPELPRQLAEAFALHPWVEKVVAVRNIYPATVTVELEYRQPAAFIEVPQGYYAVDVNGVLLPPTDFGAEDLSKYLPVRGVSSRPSSAAGKVWNDPGVVGAAKLAAILGPRWKELGLAAIEIPAPLTSSPDDLRFELRTRGGSRILWGRVPGSTHPGELAARQKLGRLEKYRAEFGSFDEPNGPYEIDIRHWQEISRRSLGNPHSNTAERGTRQLQR